MAEVKKMAFYELGKITDRGTGKTYFPMVDEMQNVFEEIQFEATERKGKASVVLKITVEPRESKDDMYGKASYSITTSIPPKKSKPFTTKLNEDGVITSTGDNRVDVDQLNLEFNTATITQITTKQ